MPSSNTAHRSSTILIGSGRCVRWASTRLRSLAANRHHSTVYATGMIDLERHVVFDMVESNSAADLRRWSATADADWLGGIEVVATDLAESLRAGPSPHLDHDRRVADSFHVVRVGNRCVDQVRRRVQNEPLGHRPANVTRCIGSASCCSPAQHASTNAAWTR